MTFASDRSKQPADALISRISTEAKSSAIAVQCNLGALSSAAEIVDATIKAFGHIDIIVNNAATLCAEFLVDVTPEDFEFSYNVNVRAPLMLLQSALPYLRRPGRIINISSVGSRASFAGTGIYASTKAALEALTRVWASELGQDGTTVNAVNPGPVQSEMLEQVRSEIITRQKETTAVENRVGTPQEIAEVVAFLAEERSSWVTGQCISASGGYAMY